MFFSKNFLIGQELVNRKYISQEQLDEGLIYHQGNNVRLGKALIQLGYLKETDLVKVIADQLGIEALDLSGLEFNDNSLGKVPQELVKSLGVIPISCDDDELTVCVVDPLQKKLREKLENATDCDIKFTIASEKEIMDAIEKYYDFD